MIEIRNPGNKHIACAVVVDTSGSMYGNPSDNLSRRPIDELNDGLVAFGEALKEDSLAYGCADVCIIKFDNTVQTLVPFSAAAEYSAPHLTAYGRTAMNEAIITALDAIEQRKQEYRDIGVDYWRPWIFLLTDGLPTDTEYESAARQRLTEALDQRKINFFPMGIGEYADIAKLKSYTAGGNGIVLKAEKDNFKDAFVWLSRSMVIASNSNPSTTKVDLPPVPPTISIAL